MNRIIVLTLPVTCFFTLALAAAWQPSLEFPEPVPPGCQNLFAKPVRPIQLKGRVFGTYLPDGRRYTKLREPSPPDYWELGLLDFSKPVARIEKLTTDLRHDAEVRVSPDGRKIVWTSRPALDFFDGENTLELANTDMTERKVLVTGKDVYMGIPSFFKPGGAKVMFSKQGEGDAAAKLIVLDLQTLAMAPFKTAFKGQISDPQMSRDGKKIVFKSGDPKDEDSVALYLMDSDGRSVQKLTKGDFRDEDPAFSPDGKTVAFERMYGMAEHKSPTPGDYFWKEGIVSVDLASGRETQLTVPDNCGKNELWLPTWSPDGELLMFTRGLHLENGEFTHDLWMMRKDGSDLQRVPHSEGMMFIDWVE